MATPTVSVIMPVYNAHLYVAKAIESVLQQTYQDFELILVDDGATDGSGEIAKSMRRRMTALFSFMKKTAGSVRRATPG